MRSFEFDEVRDLCLSYRYVSESFPFDTHTMVWKVEGKVFAIADIDDFTGISLKCSPERAIELREQFLGIRPGWHLNKKHWNSVDAESDVPLKLVGELIEHSYERVVASMTKKSRLELGL